MKRFNIITQALFLASCTLVTQNSFIIQQVTTQKSCSQDKFGQIFKGSDIFSQLVGQLNRITITGWIFSTSFANVENSIISIKENSNSILDFNYNFLPQKLYKLYLAGTQYQKEDSSFKIKTWYFLKIFIYKSNVSGTTITLNSQFKIFKTDGDISLPAEVFFTSNNIKFEKNDIEISLGWSKSSTSFYSCCCFMRLFKVFWNDIIEDSYIFGQFRDLSAGVYNQIYQIDFQSNINNEGYINNLVGFQDNLELKYFHYNPAILKSYESIRLDEMSFFESNGFTLSFYFRIFNNQIQDNTILQLYSLDQRMKITIDINNNVQQTITLSSTSSKFFVISQIHSNIWAQIILTIKQNYFTSVYLILKQQNVDVIQPFTLDSFYFKYVSFEFGSQIQHGEFQLSYVNIYQGTIILETTECNYQMILKNNQQCLQCKENYLIDIQNNHKCIAGFSNNQTIPGVKNRDYPLIQCQQGMILNLNQNKCNCRQQHYLKNGKCFKCPKYCNECFDETNCIQGGIGRVNGVCPNDTFDDGYNCLKDYSYKIPNQINTLFYHSATDLDYDPSCLQNKNQDAFIFNSNNSLDLKNNDSFYFGFYMSYKGTDPNNESIIGYFENQGQLVFYIKFYKQTDFLMYIQILDQNNQVLSNILFSFLLGFWIGIWTDLQKAVITLSSSGIFISQEIVIGLSPIYDSPKLCIGPCKTTALLSLPYFCGKFKDLPIVIIKNLKMPVNKDEYSLLSQFPFIQSTVTNYYIFTPNDALNLQKAKNLVNGAYDQIFMNGDILHKNILGFATHKTFNSIINVIDNYPTTFSCSVYIESIQKTTNFIKFTLNQQISYQFVPHESQQHSQLQICYGGECQSTQKCMLDHQQINFLLIKYNQKCIYCSTQRQDEFEIVINYCRETIFFLYSYVQSQYNYIQIGDGNNSQEQFLIYYNYLKIYKSNGYFYVSYNLSDRCFIYTDLSNLKCLLPKDGYYLLGNQIVTKNECLQLNIDGDQLYSINEYSKECFNTQLNSKLCIEFDLITNQCLKCRDINLEKDTFCKQCKDGYIYDRKTTSCKPCHFKCTKCEERYDNCTSCKYGNSQNPPSCECNSLQFLNGDNLECINCSSKCLNCQDNKDNCLQCAYKRKFPPQCDCDTNLYLSNENCDDIQCDMKCLSCEQNSSLCTKCQAGRINPPECQCDTNYYHIKTGECIQCNSDEYFDNKLQQCQQCSLPCSKCYENKFNCIECQQGAILINNQCKCSSGNIIINDKGGIQCVEAMDTKLQVRLKDNQYYLDFIFEYNLKQIDLNQEYPSKIMSLYLMQIPENLYYLKDFQVENNILSACIVVKQNFKSSQGTVIINKTELFISDSEKYVLNESYQHNPIQFNIGPLFLVTSDLETKGLDQVLTNVKNANENIISIIQQFQIVFYFLNTLQPTVMILLYKAQLPPNLYKLCQLYGIFVFPNLSDYQTQNTKTSFSLFGFQLNSQDIQVTSLKQLQKLGISNSLLVNILIIIIKQLFIFLLLFLVLMRGLFGKKFFINQKLDKQWLRIKVFAINKIFTENETNLLMVTLCILSQLCEDEKEEQWPYRYGIYISFIQILYQIIQFKFVFKNLTNQDSASFDLIEPFTQRLVTNKAKLGQYYFFFQMFKKYLIIFILFFLHDYPQFVGASISLIFFLSSVQTYYQQPYKSKKTRIIKIIGEIMLSVVWINLLQIQSLEKEIFQQITIKQDQIDLYLRLGSIIIILLLIFSVLYFIEFLAPLFQKLKEFTQKPNQKDQSINKDLINTKEGESFECQRVNIFEK